MFKIATIDDLELVKELLRKNVEDSPYKGEINVDAIPLKEFMENPEKVIFFITEQDKVIGITAFETVFLVEGQGKVSRILPLYLEPEYRGKGITKKIISLFETWSRLEGCSKASIGVSAENVSLEKDGYKKCEVIYMKDLV